MKLKRAKLWGIHSEGQEPSCNTDMFHEVRYEVSGTIHDANRTIKRKNRNDLEGTVTDGTDTNKKSN